MTTIKECLTGSVTFQYYRKGNLWYKADNGFLFPVPVHDTGDADFLTQDRAILFMRWIRKELTTREQESALAAPMS